MGNKCFGGKKENHLDEIQRKVPGLGEIASETKSGEDPYTRGYKKSQNKKGKSIQKPSNITQQMMQPQNNQSNIGYYGTD